MLISFDSLPYAVDWEEPEFFQTSAEIGFGFVQAPRWIGIINGLDTLAGLRDGPLPVFRGGRDDFARGFFDGNREWIKLRIDGVWAGRLHQGDVELDFLYFFNHALHSARKNETVVIDQCEADGQEKYDQQKKKQIFFECEHVKAPLII